LFTEHNAGRQLLPEAGATQERTLEAVSCTPWLGSTLAEGNLETGLRTALSGPIEVEAPGGNARADADAPRAADACLIDNSSDGPLPRDRDERESQEPHVQHEARELATSVEDSECEAVRINRPRLAGLG